jgi:hypothetical protein
MHRHHVIQMLAAVLLAFSLLLVAYSAINAIDEPFQLQALEDPNIKSFTDFKQLWGTRAVQSGLIAPRFFPTYQSILDIPPPVENVKKEPFELLVASTAQMIKVWYVNARYGGNLAQLSQAIDSSKPQWTPPLEPKLPIKPGTESEVAAQAGLKAAVDYEMVTFFLPIYTHYKYVLEIYAKSYQTDIEATEQRLVDENPDLIPMYSTFNDIEGLKTAPYSESVKYAATLTVLPKTVDLYTTTLNFLIKKADESYNLINSVASGDLAGAQMQAAALGAPPTDLVSLQGADAASMGISIGFADFKVPTDFTLGKLSSTMSITLDKIKEEFGKDSQAAANKYLQIAQTRRRLLESGKPDFDKRLNTANNVFRRLIELQKQATENPNYAQILSPSASK